MKLNLNVSEFPNVKVSDVGTTIRNSLHLVASVDWFGPSSKTFPAIRPNVYAAPTAQPNSSSFNESKKYIKEHLKSLTLLK